MKIVLTFFFILTTLFGFQSYNYIDKHFKFTTEAELAKKYPTIISPYFYAHKLHYFTTIDNIHIAYKIFLVKHAKANIVIASGRTEGMVKYQELIYDLNQNGYNVYILDHRGQGYSDRLVKDRQLGYVESFFHYVDDLKFFVDNCLPKKKKRVLLSHSMGGAIASLYMEVYPHDFNGLILCSPMHQPDLLLPSMSSFLCEIMESRTKNLQRYVAGTASYNIEKYAFNKNDLTHSKIRFKIMKKAYKKEPETIIGGPSLKWLQEACKWSKISVEQAGLIRVPTLLLSPSDDDVVTREAEEKFCKNATGFCQGYSIEGAYHELFIEKDKYREKALTAILKFITKILH